MTAGQPPGDPLRSDLARLVRELLDEAPGHGNAISAAIRAHLGVDAVDLPVHGHQLPAIELPNLQLALDAALARDGRSHQLLGIAGQGRRWSDMTLSDLLVGGHVLPGPPEYVQAPIGPARTLACLSWSLLLVDDASGPLVLFVRLGEENGPMPGLLVQAVAPRAGAPEAFLAELRALMGEHDVYRGQVLTVETDRTGNRRVVFLERPALEEDELVLPPGALERIERHVVAPSRHRAELLAAGRHLGRGLLLWGPPGTGKTHTVRYLIGVLEEATVIVLSGASLGMVGMFGALARRLAPSVIVLEDVDLVAQERMLGPYGSSPVLFELMNEMSGLAEDADVAFVLTTNRPDTLEPALAARPGRVDLAVEIPLPDAGARQRLLDLYGRGLQLEGVDLDDIVRRSEGLTASFFKELWRKAALASIARGSRAVTGADVSAALDELLAETAALTRALLSGPGCEPGAPGPHDWLGAPGWAAFDG